MDSAKNAERLGQDALQEYISLEAGIPASVENPNEAQFYRSISLEDDHAPSGPAARSHGHGGSIKSHDLLARRVSNISRNKQRRSSSFEADLTENAVPPPVDEPADDRAEESRSRPESSQNTTPASKVATELYTISYLIFFSILGTLARVGVSALTTYPGAPVTTGVLWANFGGTLFLGFLIEDQKLFQEEWGSPSSTKTKDEIQKTEFSLERLDTAARKKQHHAVKKTIPLFIGLATGFCGSFTSFSSFQRDVFLAVSNSASPPTSRNGGYSFLALLANMILTLCLCLSSLQLGAHIALGLDRFTPSISFRLMRKVLDRVMVPMALTTWVAALFMAIWPPDRPSGPDGKISWDGETWRGDVIFAVLFAPPGCLVRFYVSIWLNSRLPAFPLGTFAVNIGGTLIESMCFDLQHPPLPGGVGGGRVGCQVLQGVMDGFCGCLTTISTWIAELKGLQRRHSYVYGGTTLGIGLAVVLVSMGSLKWSIGFAETACGK